MTTQALNILDETTTAHHHYHTYKQMCDTHHQSTEIQWYTLNFQWVTNISNRKNLIRQTGASEWIPSKNDESTILTRRGKNVEIVILQYNYNNYCTPQIVSHMKRGMKPVWIENSLSHTLGPALFLCVCVRVRSSKTIRAAWYRSLHHWTGCRANFMTFAENVLRLIKCAPAAR